MLGSIVFVLAFTDWNTLAAAGVDVPKLSISAVVNLTDASALT
jgi:hypothetical protein